MSHLLFSCSSLNASLEIQISALKEDLEKEHQRWHSAQANYERQVNWRVFVYFFFLYNPVLSHLVHFGRMVLDLSRLELLILDDSTGPTGLSTPGLETLGMFWDN